MISTPMPRYRNDYDDDAEDRDPEEPDDFDRDDEDDLYGTDTDPCPSCHREIHYQTDICPHCGHFIARNDPPYSHRTVWIIAALALLLAAALMILATGAAW